MRGLLPRILLLAVPVVIGCSSSSDPGTSTGNGFLSNSSNCTTHTHLNVSVASPAPPPVQLRIESCRLDVDACTDLCTYELNHLQQYPEWLGGMQPPPVFTGGGGFGGAPDQTGAPGVPAGFGTPGLVPSTCKVTFDGSTANAEIVVDTPNFGSGCAEPVGTPAGGGGGGSGGGGL